MEEPDQETATGAGTAARSTAPPDEEYYDIPGGAEPEASALPTKTDPRSWRH